MVHMIRQLKCKKGHHLPITFDENKCGCHDDGKPCLIINCKECFEEVLKKGEGDSEQIYIPLDEDGMKVINKLLRIN